MTAYLCYRLTSPLWISIIYPRDFLFLKFYVIILYLSAADQTGIIEQFWSENVNPINFRKKKLNFGPSTFLKAISLVLQNLSVLN